MKNKITTILILIFLASIASAEWISPGIKQQNTITKSDNLNTNLGLGDSYKYETKLSKSNMYEAYFKTKSSNTIKHPVAIKKDDWILTQSPQDINIDGKTIGKKASDTVWIDRESGTVVYPSQYGHGMDLEFKYENNKLKQHLIIDNITRLPDAKTDSFLRFRNKIRAYKQNNLDKPMRMKVGKNMLLEGETIENVSDTLSLIDDTGKTIYTMITPYAIDNKGNNIQLTYSVDVTSFGNIVVDVYVPVEWLVKAEYPIKIDPSWTTPDNVISHSTEEGSPSYPAANTIDGDTGTWWTEEGVAFGEQAAEAGETYDWFITLNTTSSYEISKVRVYADGDGASAPCKIGVVKVCDDAGCIGESNLLSSDCTFSTSEEWQECSFTATTGSYVRLEGGIYDSSCVNQDSGRMTKMNEIEFYAESTPTTTTTTTTLPGAGYLDTGGACLTEYGYNITYYTFCGGGAFDPDYLGINLSYMSEYCRDTECNNIWSDTNDLYVNGTYYLLADVRLSNKCNVTLHIAGFDQDYNHTALNATADLIRTPILNDWTRENPSYYITLKDEETEELFNISYYDPLEMIVLCDSYSPNTINLKTLNYTEFYIPTKEQPLLHIEAGDIIDRKFESYLSTENITFYIPIILDANDVWIVSYVLESYLSGWDNSYLKIIRNTNTSLVTMYQEQWNSLQVQNVPLLNGTYYQYVVYDPSDDTTRIIKWDKITDNQTRTIVIQEPTYTEIPKYIDEIEVGVTSSYDNSQIGLTYDVGGAGIVNVTFIVHNYTSDSGFQPMDTTIATTSSGSITVTVPDNNQTYYVTADIYTTDHGKISFNKIASLAITEDRFPFYDSWGIPATVYGVSRDRIYTGAAMFIITGFAFMMSGLEVATGGLIVVAVIGVMTFLGWLREMTWGLWLVLAALAIAYKLVEGRKSE